MFASLQKVTKKNTIQIKPFLLTDCKNVSISILFQKIFLAWKLFSIINGREVGIRMSGVEKSQKSNQGWCVGRWGRRLLGPQE